MSILSKIRQLFKKQDSTVLPDTVFEKLQTEKYMPYNGDILIHAYFMKIAMEVNAPAAGNMFCTGIRLINETNAHIVGFTNSYTAPSEITVAGINLTKEEFESGCFSLNNIHSMPLNNFIEQIKQSNMPVHQILEQYELKKKEQIAAEKSKTANAPAPNTIQ